MNTKRLIRIGTRESRLAIAQTGLVVAALQQQNPDITFALVPMKTRGDKDLSLPIDSGGSQAMFSSALDEALLRGEVDLCVHSYKDLPAEEDPRLPIVALSPRENPFDTLVLPDRGMDRSKPLGCSCARRRRQFALLYPDWETAPIRGDVAGRIEQMNSGLYGGLVLAAAGLNRLGWSNKIARLFTLDEMIPSACQGILALQATSALDTGFLAGFDDQASRVCAAAERAFVRAMQQNGCFMDAVYAQLLPNDTMLVTALAMNDNGQLIKETATGGVESATELGKQLAQRLLPSMAL